MNKKDNLSDCECGGVPDIGFESDTGYFVTCGCCEYETKHSQDLDLVIARWNVRNLSDQAMKLT
jgi:hypothetical protein